MSATCTLAYAAALGADAAIVVVRLLERPVGYARNLW